MQSLPTPLLPLAAYQQWVCWFAVPHPEKLGVFNKFPCDWRTGEVIDAHNPAYWTSAACALAMAPQWDRGYGGGGGFVFTDQDPFFFLDIDHAREGDGWSTLALDLCQRLAGAAVEVSHSGEGLHVIGSTAPFVHGTRNRAFGLELYTSKRFVALTGSGAMGDAGAVMTGPLLPLALQLFPVSAATAGTPLEWTSAPVEGWSGPTDDAELIRRARKPNPGAMLSGRQTFDDLWTGKVDPNGQSEADQALANHLAFWTGKNCERMERLMRMSALVREKWDTPRPEGTYLTKTILAACAFVGKVATGSPSGPIPTPNVVIPQGPPGARDAALEYMTAFSQIDHFKDCYYVTEIERVFSLKHNQILKRSAFDVLYGGHLFVLDPMGQKTTDSAWDAFTQSRVNKCLIVDGLCFRPEIPPATMVLEGSRYCVNSYVPYEPVTAPGDPGKMIRHLEKMIPLTRDREILLAYVASMAQNPGVKFQWWPVLQGAKGNGKTLLIELMSYTMGEHYTHLPNAHSMARNGMQFNGWVDRKLFIGIEEISLSHKRDFLDEFKVVVTNRRIPLEKKGVDQINTDNRANGILCTNHKDGVPVDADERRYAIIYCAQQSAADIERDGMGGDYFPDLVDWLRGQRAYEGQTPGLAICAHWLKTMPIAVELDPARASHRAPATSSTREAIMASLGRVEQEIIEAIEEGRPGFANGWVSSRYLDALIDGLRAPVPRSKRRELMKQLGYDWHPSLGDGRVNTTVTPDNSRPKLYLKLGHPALRLTEPADIAHAYSRDQNGTVAPTLQSAVVLPWRPR